MQEVATNYTNCKEVYNCGFFLSLFSTSINDNMNPIDIYEYINNNLENLKPPVSNILLFSGKQLKVMIVGGPNERDDYHLNMGEELFIQIQGNINLKVCEPSLSIDNQIPINKGEIYLLPYCIPHSPQRYANTIGIVFERTRLENELDGLRWYKENNPDQTKNILYEKFFHCYDLGTQIKDAILEFRDSRAFKISQPLVDYENDLNYLNIHRNFNQKISSKENLLGNQPFQLFNDLNFPIGIHNIIKGKEFTVDLIVGNSCTYELQTVLHGELFLWQLKGSSTIRSGDNSINLKLNDVILYPIYLYPSSQLQNNNIDDIAFVLGNNII